MKYCNIKKKNLHLFGQSYSRHLAKKKKVNCFDQPGTNFLCQINSSLGKKKKKKIGQPSLSHHGGETVLITESVVGTMPKGFWRR